EIDCSKPCVVRPMASSDVSTDWAKAWTTSLARDLASRFRKYWENSLQSCCRRASLSALIVASSSATWPACSWGYEWHEQPAGDSDYGRDRLHRQPRCAKAPR